MTYLCHRFKRKHENLKYYFNISIANTLLSSWFRVVYGPKRSGRRNRKIRCVMFESMATKLISDLHYEDRK